MKPLRYPALALVVIALGACADQSPTAPTPDVVPQAASQASEQVIFSGTATGSLGNVGFWVWCEAESNNPYDEECNGALNFFSLGITRHVEGEVEELSEGIYKATFDSTRDDAVSCTLQNNAEAVHGPHNSVTLVCTTPSGSATTTTAVVNVTG